MLEDPEVVVKLGIQLESGILLQLLPTIETEVIFVDYAQFLSC